ncbi:MAG: GIY-YIG nuclease family protein [Patescibacteria group bacterium]|jgi:putative endonuclease
MFNVYILISLSSSYYYIGHTVNIVKRLKQHNSGHVRSTKRGIPWILVYKEICKTKSEAYKRELLIKSYKGGEAFKRLIKK